MSRDVVTVNELGGGPKDVSLILRVRVLWVPNLPDCEVVPRVRRGQTEGILKHRGDNGNPDCEVVPRVRREEEEDPEGEETEEAARLTEKRFLF